MRLSVPFHSEALDGGCARRGIGKRMDEDLILVRPLLRERGAGDLSRIVGVAVPEPRAPRACDELRWGCLARKLRVSTKNDEKLVA